LIDCDQLHDGDRRNVRLLQRADCLVHCGFGLIALVMRRLAAVLMAREELAHEAEKMARQARQDNLGARASGAAVRQA
jgi:heme exporter protein D